MKTWLKGGILVAIVFSGTEAFKRIGDSVPGVPHLRIFQSVGGLGKSIIVRTEKIDNDKHVDIPLLQQVRKIVGVIYDNC